MRKWDYDDGHADWDKGRQKRAEGIRHTDKRGDL